MTTWIKPQTTEPAFKAPKPPGTVYFLRGLQGSGKSTRAREMQAKDPSLVIVDKDSLRALLHQSVWTKENEKQVVAVETSIVEDCMRRGRSVVVHNCHMEQGKIHEHRYRDLAARHAYDFEVIDLTDVPVSVCIARDALRDNPVGEDVIRRTAKGKGIPECKPVPHDDKLTNVLICDLDNTLALHNGNRSPYDYSKVGGDTLNEPLAWLLLFAMTSGQYRNAPKKIVFFSGREDWCRPQTEEWLRKNWFEDVPWELHMRKSKDNRQDDIVKRELYEAHVKGRHNVIMWFDDRDRVVAQVRALGLPCAQVNYGGF